MLTDDNVSEEGVRSMQGFEIRRLKVGAGLLRALSLCVLCALSLRLA